MVVVAFLLLATGGYCFAFGIQKTHISKRIHLLSMSDSATEGATAATSMAQIRRLVNQVTPDTWDLTLARIEPFLLNESGSTFYAKTIRRLKRNGKMMEQQKEVPPSFAREAVCTRKRRKQQEEYEERKQQAAAAEVEERAAKQAEETSTIDDTGTETPTAEKSSEDSATSPTNPVL